MTRLYWNVCCQNIVYPCDCNKGRHLDPWSLRHVKQCYPKSPVSLSAYVDNGPVAPMLWNGEWAPTALEGESMGEVSEASCASVFAIALALIGGVMCDWCCNGATPSPICAMPPLLRMRSCFVE